MSAAELQSLFKLTLPDLPTLEHPPLPIINDADIKKQVFTHTSFHAKTRRTDDGMFEEHGESLDNEKLEHVGDSSLGFAVTGLLHDLYPTLTPHTATVMKSHLVSNTTLAQLSKRYGLPEQLLADQSAVYTLRNSEKTMANIFEAYIAGVFYSYLKHGSGHGLAMPTPPRSPSGHSTPDPSHNSLADQTSTTSPITRGQAQDHVELWLRPLFTPIAAWLLEHLKQERAKLTSVNGEEDRNLDRDAVGAMSSVNQWFTSYGTGCPTYVSEEAAGNMWTIHCRAVDKEGREWLSEATRPTKKGASSVAALKIGRAAGIIKKQN